MQPTILATNVETPTWNAALQHMRDLGWTTIYEYDNYDKGIDSDLIVLGKDGERIYFGWDNWFEGEICCQPERMKYIETFSRTSFTKGETNGILRAEILDRYK